MSIPISERSMPAATIAFSPASAAALVEPHPLGPPAALLDPGELLEQAGAHVAAREDVGELLVDPGGGDDLGSLDRRHGDDADAAVTLCVVPAHLRVLSQSVVVRLTERKRPFQGLFRAERRDLNPRSTFQHLRDFQSRSFGHSDTSPWLRQRTSQLQPTARTASRVQGR